MKVYTAMVTYDGRYCDYPETDIKEICISYEAAERYIKSISLEEIDKEIDMSIIRKYKEEVAKLDDMPEDEIDYEVYGEKIWYSDIIPNNAIRAIENESGIYAYWIKEREIYE